MAVRLNLGVHLGFAINRYPEPMEWAKLASEELGVRNVQFVSDLLQPSFPNNIINEEIDKIREACQKYGLKITHTFTSPRWNFFGHPSKKVQNYWLWWFKRFADISQRLGAISTGSLLGIFSVKDFDTRRDFIFNEIIRNWHRLAEYSKRIGLQFLTWEPMSIPREMGETIQETRRIMEALNNSKKPAIPILLCLDVDHGDVSSNNPDDVNPYVWIRVFGKKIPVMHVKQRTKNVFGYKPFTPEHNKEGMIFPERVIEALEDSGAKEVTLFLEISFRERQPYEGNVIKDLKASVEFWRPYIKD